jgi:hypothetical protein
VKTTLTQLSTITTGGQQFQALDNSIALMLSVKFSGKTAAFQFSFFLNR